MSQRKHLPVKLWGPMLLTVMAGLYLNNTTVAADTESAAPQDSGSQTTAVETAPAAVSATLPISLPEADASTSATSQTDTTNSPEAAPAATVETTAEPSGAAPTPATADPAPAVSNEPATPTDSRAETTLPTTALPLTDSNTVDRAAANEKPAKPYGVESNTIINVPPVWNENYKGQGTVVAVIDSGIDVEHDVLRLTDVEAAKFKSEEEMEAKKAEAGINYGKWYNDKLIFAYNYTDVNDDLKESNTKSHGMHVSGTAIGNPSKPDASGNYIYGVAPEAQLMFMRVFSDVRGGGTQDLLYVRAIEDAVKLGADTINLSLGSPNGSLIDSGDHLNRAIAAARAKGVTVVMAAGNDYNFGGQTHPYASNPDYGVVASPATARDGIAVASYNNTHITREVLNITGMEGMEEFKNGSVAFTRGSNSKRDFQAGKEYDYVYVNLGKEEDFEGKELKGKIALIQRGEINFSVKVENAMKAGAAGAIVFNNVSQTQLFTMTIPGPETALFPSAFINKEVGDELAAKSGTGTYKIKFSGSFEVVENPDAGQMSEFTSWGLSVDGELKPDVTAPGGEIFSSHNNDTYGSSSGTSMASPHIAGVVALMKQALKDKWPELSPAEFQTRLKQLLMSTALPHFNTETNAYTSPRQQGAGIADTYNGIHSDLFVTGLDDLSSISLGNVKDSFTVNVRLHNTSDQAKTVKYVTHLNTDGVEEGRFTLKPRELAKIEGGEVTVDANSSLLIPITLDASSFAEELSKLMVNGYYLEGFVRFLDAVDGGDLVSIPFVGFRGEFQDLPVVEKPVYDFDFNNGDLPFYMTRGEDAIEDNLEFNDTDPFTSLIFSESLWDHEKGIYQPEYPKVAGTFENKDGKYILKRDENGKPYLILSPGNFDSTHDALMFRGVFLRSYKDLVATVYREDDTERANPLWWSQPASGSKNHYGNDPGNAKATPVLQTLWEGKDMSKELLPDGKYVYVVTYTPRVPGAKQQETVFNIELNSIRPAATTAIIDEEARTFKPRPSITNGGPAIWRERVYYTIPVAERQTTDPDNPDSGVTAVYNYEERVYIEPDENGVYTLPTHDKNGKELKLSDFWFRIENLAGSQLSANVTEYLHIGNEGGQVQLGLFDVDTQNWAELDLRYTIRDESGELIHDSTHSGPGAPHHTLPFGTYTVELFLYDEENAYLVDDRIKHFTLDEETSLNAVFFNVKVLKRAPFIVDFDTEPPVGTKIYLVDKDGNKIELPQGRYTKDIFEKNIVTGDYTIDIELPEGYEPAEDNFTYSIVPETGNRKPISFKALPEFDHDGDGYTTEDETIAGSNPFDATSIPLTAKGDQENGGAAATADPLPAFDTAVDHDGDGFSTKEELDLGTDPMDKSDFPQTAKGDQEKGGAAAEEEEKPAFNMDDDHDGDGFSTAEEMEAGTDPFHAGTFPQTDKGDSHNGNLVNDDKPFFDVNEDHDGDGFTSKEELDANTNPLDKNSFPVKKEDPVTPPVDDPKDNNQTPTAQDKDKETPGDKKDEDKPTPPTPDVPKDKPTDKAAQQPVKTDKQPTLKPVTPAARPTASQVARPTTAAAAPQKASLPATGDQASALTLVGATMTVLAAYYLTRRKRH